jgi:HD-GYP domain-containing protein (c-di-GMP phosphodiesterase class II)/anti-sigma regulatory factor (Ser/Thr protein kinase)
MPRRVETPSGRFQSPAYEAYTELLAHELRTPVATIALYLDLLSRERALEDPATRREYLEVAREQAQHLTRLVQELTMFTGLASGAVPVPSSSTTPVESLPALVANLAGMRRVSTEITPEAAAATADADRLRVVLEQLLNNAFKFGTPGTEVLVKGEVVPDPPRLVVRVINQGDPIEASMREHIFQAFAQAEDPSTREHGGLGLGLTVARGAAEGGTGVLELESGEPTTFRLELPLREDPLARETRALREQMDLLDRQAGLAIQDLRIVLTEGRRKDAALQEAESRQNEISRDLEALHRLARQLSLQLNQSYLQTVTAFSRAIEARSTVLADHTELVRRTAVNLAQALGLSSAQRLEVEVAAILHDLGKLTFPDALLEPGADGDERLRAYPELGADILDGVEHLTPVREAVLAHREHWDGSGFPRGLTAEQISQTARVVGLADDYARLREEGCAHADAVERLSAGRGTLYDSLLVDTLAALPAQ